MSLTVHIPSKDVYTRLNMGMGYIVALIMKQKDWAAEFKPIIDIMSGLAMTKGYISRFEKR